VWRLFKNESGGADGVAEAFDAGDAAGFHATAIHEKGVKLDAAVGGEEAAAAGVEGGIVLEDGDGGFDGVEGGPAESEAGVAGFEGIADAGLVRGGGIGRDGPGAAVDEEDGIVHGWGGHGDYGSSDARYQGSVVSFRRIGRLAGSEAEVFCGKKCVPLFVSKEQRGYVARKMFTMSRINRKYWIAWNLGEIG